MKIGRNELCPCNSGLKMKRCCGSVEAADSTLAAYEFAEDWRLGQNNIEVLELMERVREQIDKDPRRDLVKIQERQNERR